MHIKSLVKITKSILYKAYKSTGYLYTVEIVRTQNYFAVIFHDQQKCL